jgi:hypothetical protein
VHPGIAYRAQKDLERIQREMAESERLWLEMKESERSQRETARPASKDCDTDHGKDAMRSEWLKPTDALVDISASPPLHAEYLLYLVLSRSEREAVIGDLLEEYRLRVFPRFGPSKAIIWYWSEVLRSILPFLWCRARVIVKWTFLADLLHRFVARIS